MIARLARRRRVNLLVRRRLTGRYRACYYVLLLACSCIYPWKNSDPLYIGDFGRMGCGASPTSLLSHLAAFLPSFELSCMCPASFCSLDYSAPWYYAHFAATSHPPLHLRPSHGLTLQRISEEPPHLIPRQSGDFRVYLPTLGSDGQSINRASDVPMRHPRLARDPLPCERSLQPITFNVCRFPRLPGIYKEDSPWTRYGWHVAALFSRNQVTRYSTWAQGMLNICLRSGYLHRAITRHEVLRRIIG